MYLGNSGEVDEDLILAADPVMLLVLQGVFSAFMFVGASLLFVAVALKVPVREFFPKISLSTFGLTLLIAVSFMIVNSAIGEWNMNLDFPDSAFEDWAKQSEDQLKKLTDHLVDFKSSTHFILALIVVGIIPAIGEELLFRGLIQSLLSRAFGNHHVAIWVSAFIFAAIHMQFYGVVPRMMLGAVFGYLYHWSGKLSVAMIAHFINNGLALFLLYMAQMDIIEVSPEQMESSAPWPAVAVFGVITIIAMNAFYRKHREVNE